MVKQFGSQQWLMKRAAPPLRVASMTVLHARCAAAPSERLLTLLHPPTQGENNTASAVTTHSLSMRNM